MFSSIVSLLPSSLHVGDHPNDHKSHNDHPSDDEDEKPENQTRTAGPASEPTPADELGVKPKDKDPRRNPIETFIFVRPPPSKSNHPLNLQVQLVPPNSRAPTGLVAASRHSIESVYTVTGPTPTPNNPFPDNGTTIHNSPTSTTQDIVLERTPSITSTTSASGYGSTSSIASTASSTSSGRRAIIPLYNLQAHNVKTNIIVDAGTDAKVAKFQKKGIEIIDLATLEPVEVWGDPTTGLPLTSGSTIVADGSMPARSSAFSQRRLQTQNNGHANSRPVTPDTTNVNGSLSATSSATSVNSITPTQHKSLSSDNIPAIAMTVTDAVPPLPLSSSTIQLPVATQSSAGGKRNLFGRLFKRNSDIIKDGLPAPPIQMASSASSENLRNGTNESRGGSAESTTPGNARSGLPSVPTVILPTPTFPITEPSDKPTPTLNTKASSGGLVTHARQLSSQIQNIPPLTSNSKRSFTQLPARGSREGLGSGFKFGASSRDIDGLPPPSGFALPGGGDAALGLYATTSASSIGSQADSVTPQMKDYPIAQGNGTTTSAATSAASAQALIRPPVLGLQAMLCAPLPNPVPKGARALMYVWAVKKWIKKQLQWVSFLLLHLFAFSNGSTEDGLSIMSGISTDNNGGGGGGGSGFLSGLMKSSSNTASAAGAPTAMGGVVQLRDGQIEVRFEWRRGGVGKRKAMPSSARSNFGNKNEIGQQNPNQSQNGIGLGLIGPDGASLAAGNESVNGKKRLSGIRPKTGEMGERSVSVSGMRRVSLKFEATPDKGREKEKDKDKKKQAKRRFSFGSPRASTGDEADEDESGSPKIKSLNKKESGSKFRDKARRERERSDSTVTQARQDDVAEESDPEDSETPWICTLKVKRLGGWPSNTPTPSRSPARAPVRSSVSASTIVEDIAGESSSASASTSTLDHQQQSQRQRGRQLSLGEQQRLQLPSLQTEQDAPPPPNQIKIKVGTLSPTPHHPKVVAMLKVPYALPDVEVDRLRVVNRKMERGAGPVDPHRNSGSPGYAGITLTAEEIKDIVCSTGMWLVVRERFCGIGKVDRKGDGWRIRA